MYRNKTGKLKKGYVLLYTLLVGLIIMLILIYSFTLELKKTKNVENYKKYIGSVRKYEEYREYLLTELSQRLKTSADLTSKESLKGYLTANTVIIRVDGNKGALRYNSGLDTFCVDSYIDNYSYKREIYDYDVINNNIKFTFRRDEFVEGGIQ
jgi:hypothetical protein